MPKQGEEVGKLYGIGSVMGQALMNPPTVEGWHTGHEWIDGGTLNERVNFAVNQFNDLSVPGLSDIISRLGDHVKSSELLDKCLAIIGPFELGKQAYDALTEYAEAVGDLDLTNEASIELNNEYIARMVQLIL